MRKVVIDTNIAVSALLTPTGNAARIIDMITDEKLQICYNTEILDEYVAMLTLGIASAKIRKNTGMYKFLRYTQYCLR